MRVLGIDPGRQGALVAVESSSLEVLDYMFMPYDGKELDVTSVLSFVNRCNPDLVVLERQIAMPKQGRSSLFSLASGYGALRATLACAGVSYITPLPNAWTKVALAGVPGSGRGKGRNIAAAKRMFPDFNMSPGRRRVDHDGLADAVMLAYYGCIKHKG